MRSDLRLPLVENGKVHAEPHMARGGSGTAMVNLVVATLGAGLLPLPSVFHKAGILPSLVMMSIIGLVSMSSSARITQCLDVSRSNDFESLCLHAGGRSLKFLGSLMIFLFCFGTAVGYLITLVSCIEMLDKLTHLMFGVNLPSANTVLVLAAVLVLAPLCTLESLACLQYSSMVGVFSVLLLSLVTVGRLVFVGGDFSNSAFIMLGDGSRDSALEGLSLLTFAFACQPNLPEIYSDLAAKRDMTRNIKVAFGFCGAIYALTGIAGCLTFGKNTKSNLLDNYIDEISEESSTLDVAVSMLVCLAMVINVLMAFPMNVYPMTAAVTHSFPSTVEAKHLVTVFIICVTLALAMACPSISEVFSLVGATTGAACVFILPAVFVMRLANRIPADATALRSWALGVFVAGSLLCALGTWEAL